MQIQNLPAYLIGSPHGGRVVCKAKAQEIAESVREIGLLSPLIVTPGTRYRNGTPTPGWDILAGNHRFEALFRVLNWTEIPCVVTDANGLKAELLTIDENLARRELSDAERSWQTARRKEIYEALHPETKRHVAGAHGSNRKQGNASANLAPAFTTSTSRTTGRSERTIQREAERGEKLGPILKRVAGTSLDKGVELDALAALPSDERDEIVSRAEKGERVSARERVEKPNVVKIDTDKMKAETNARRLMREYLKLDWSSRCEFDHLYTEEQKSSQPAANEAP